MTVRRARVRAMVGWASFGEAPDHQTFYPRGMAVVLTLLLIAAFAGSPWLLSLAIGTRGRRWRAWARAQLQRGDSIPQPVNRPIEEIALDVRRRGAKFHALPEHASYVKVSALRSAYD